MARLIQKPTLQTLSNPLLVLIPYLIGVTWTLCHPIISVVTGELKARGFYIDEAQLGPYEYHTDPFPVSLGGTTSNQALHHPSVDSNQYEGQTTLNLCDALRRFTIFAENHSPPPSSSSLSCHSHTSFDVIKIEPMFAPTRATEAIVIVVPPPNALTRDVQRATLLTVDRLLERRWLVKALLIVSPHYADGADGADNDGDGADNDDRLLEAVTRDLMEAISQRDPLDHQDGAVPPLPSSYTRFLIRQLFVLDFTIESSTTTTSSSSLFLPNKLYILPQGRRGTLPNLDLLSTTSQSFHKHIHQNTLEQRTHPFDTTYYESTYIDRYLIPTAQHIASSSSTLSTIREWAVDLLHLFAFCAHGVLVSSSRFGGVSHHSPALEYGIDSLTLGVRLRTQPQQRQHNKRHPTDEDTDVLDPMVGSLFRSVEHLIRGVNSLQERLHHNHNQYLLPTHQTFVSNSEYILPVILVLLSSVMRAVSLAFVEMDRFDVKGVVGVMVSIVVVSLGTSTITVVNGFWVGYYEFWILWLVKLAVMDRLIRWSSSRKEDYEEENNNNNNDDNDDDDGEEKEETTTLDPILEETSTVSESNDGTTSVNIGMEEIRGRRELRERRLLQSIQFSACLLLIYLHVPIALTHISLALPSVFFWTPLIAFPSYHNHHNHHNPRLPNTAKSALVKHEMKDGRSFLSFVLGCFRYLVGLVVLIVVWPPIALTLMGLGGKNDYVSGGGGVGVVAAAMDSAYVGLVYVPLYVLLSILLLRR